jgi:hypothetical protein
MNAVIAAGSAVLLVMIATGTYTLQSWLERADYQRHFED